MRAEKILELIEEELDARNKEYLEDLEE